MRTHAASVCSAASTTAESGAASSRDRYCGGREVEGQSTKSDLLNRPLGVAMWQTDAPSRASASVHQSGSPQKELMTTKQMDGHAEDSAHGMVADEDRGHGACDGKGGGA